MKALLKKDVLILWRSVPVVLTLMLAFAVLQALVPDSVLLGFALLYAGMIPMTVRSYDESCHWDRLAAMLPYRTFQLVFVKFLLGYLTLLGVTLVAVLSRAVVALTGGPAGEEGFALSLLLLLCVAVIMQSVCLTAVFRFGMQKGRYAYYLCLAVTFALLVGLRQSGLMPQQMGGAPALCALLALAGALAISAAGLALSCRFYRQAQERQG